MKRVNFHLTAQQVEKLEKIRRDTGIKMAEQIRRAVDAYIRDSERTTDEKADTETAQAFRSKGENGG